MQSKKSIPSDKWRIRIGMIEFPHSVYVKPIHILQQTSWATATTHKCEKRSRIDQICVLLPQDIEWSTSSHSCIIHCASINDMTGLCWSFFIIDSDVVDFLTSLFDADSWSNCPFLQTCTTILSTQCADTHSLMRSHTALSSLPLVTSIRRLFSRMHASRKICQLNLHSSRSSICIVSWLSTSTNVISRLLWHYNPHSELAKLSTASKHTRDTRTRPTTTRSDIRDVMSGSSTYRPICLRVVSCPFVSVFPASYKFTSAM